VNRLRLGAVAAAVAVYPFVEARLYRLTTRVVTVPPRAPALDVLHLSDAHLTEGNERLRSFLEGLPKALGSPPDLILATGDMIEDDSGITPLLRSLAGLEARHGAFYVHGSHDYYQAAGASYTKYFTGDRSGGTSRPADVARLERGYAELGWVGLNNSSARLDIGGSTVVLSGVDDPYLDRHRTTHIERSVADDLALALLHAPDIVSEWALHAFDVVFAGHTHGGQVRVPLMGAVVTNCSLPSGLAMGLTLVGHTWLHVSPGLGTGRYTPIRFNARPEATLLQLRPAHV
jgi:predicted MPP superfamily phosphohydrolase